MKTLGTGATGAVGGRLAHALAERGHDVRCLVRDKGKASDLEEAGFELHAADVLNAGSLKGAGEGGDVGYYLIHSMGRGASDSDFAERERKWTRAFARMARD